MANATLKKELALFNTEYKPTFKSMALNTEFKHIASAYKAGNKAMWQLAISVHKVLTDELWKVLNDFESEAAFAKAIGKSNSQVTLYKNAVDFIVNHPDFAITDKEGHLICGTIPFSKADILSRIKDYDGFCNWVQENYKAEVWTFGDNSIKTMLKAYEKPVIETKDSEHDSEQDSEQDSKQDSIKVDKEEKLVNIAIVDHDGNKIEYDNIPISIFYKVTTLLEDYRQALYNAEGDKIG